MTVSPPDRLIGACETALVRLETTRGDPPHVFAETGEVLFWLYAIGDTGKTSDHLLSPGFQWARHQYAHGNLITEAVEWDPGGTYGSMTLGRAAYGGAPRLHRWMARDQIATYPKARDHRKLSRKAEAARELLWRDYDAHLARKPVVATLWDELSELVANVNPRDLARDE